MTINDPSFIIRVRGYEMPYLDDIERIRCTSDQTTQYAIVTNLNVATYDVECFPIDAASALCPAITFKSEFWVDTLPTMETQQ